MKDFTPVEKHKALMEQLKNHPATKKLSSKLRERTGSEDWSDMDTNDINAGVALLVSFWNLTGGSVGELNLYELLQVYFKDESARKEINAVVNKALPVRH